MKCFPQKTAGHSEMACVVVLFCGHPWVDNSVVYGVVPVAEPRLCFLGLLFGWQQPQQVFN